ncbi:major intrinsic family protein [Mycobacteroides abscessus 1948]|uniref:Major intrinsic family protein n=2 Tax=Mycobacteroides abscessus TaxID=36809 RepID=A0A829QPB8_9MYCO|nr:major intrinsic family protein [Mycobacteroides abscessus 1948]
MSKTSTKLLAELFGTFWLVFGGCGSAIFAAKNVADAGEGNAGAIQLGIGFLGVALAFGLTVVTMAYAVGHISGGHFNPAVTLGAVAGGRLPAKELPGYWVAQVLGGLLAGTALWYIARGKPGFEATGNMAANGYGEHSPNHYSLAAVLVTEIVLTAGVHHGHFGCHRCGCAQGFRPVGNRLVSHTDSLDFDSDQQYVGEPGAVDRCRLLQRWCGARAAVAVLGGTADRRSDRRPAVPVLVRQQQVGGRGGAGLNAPRTR